MPFSLRSLAVVAVISLSSAAIAADQIDNPEYAQWAKYKPGTSVTLQQKMEVGGQMPAGAPQGMDMSAMMPQIKVTTKLTEVKADALTLETATETTMMGNTNTNKTTRTIPAKIDKPAATTAPATQSSLKDLKEGKDTVEVKGAKLDTTTREFTTSSTNDMPAAFNEGRGGRGAPGDDHMPTEAHVKVWSTPEVPGGTVKMELSTKQDTMEIKMNMNVVDYTVVK